MDFVTGANGSASPNITPSIIITTSSAPCIAISGAGASFVVSFITSAWAKCRD